MATKPAYLVVDLIVDDPETFKKYQQEVAPILEQFGGRYLIKGGEYSLEETDTEWKPNRIVVLQFPSMEKARAFYECDIYQPVKAIRTSSTRATLAIVEGY